jgi:hypothetical protein
MKWLINGKISQSESRAQSLNYHILLPHKMRPDKIVPF